MPSSSSVRPLHRWLALLPCLLVLGGCADDSEPAAQPPRVAIVEPLQPARPAPEPLRFAGVVQSVTSTQLSFEVPGRIERIAVDEGTHVKRGQLLAELDRTDYQLQLREAKARLAQLEADLARKRELLAEGILAPAAVEPLQANTVAARVARDSALRDLARTRLNAPFDGVIARRLVEPDMVVAVGTPVFAMQDNGHVEVAVDLPENAALSLPLGPELEAEGQLVIADLSLPLRYKEHSTQPQEGARTYRLILQGDSPEEVNVLPGMAMRVELVRPVALQAPLPEHFRVPLAALQTASDGSHYLWFAADGRARRHRVQLQAIEQGDALVAGDGLEGGRPLVVAGASKLHEGQAIEARQRN
ncbi:efflux RND transporter periplasmic adaptor subunit [Stutzerimonas balearica]|jgi:RND family efflux transporter MFP subunit|uniref:efflux RND transporter periplasmic adaptor subunit n=1 Tax=Stutzerimonas balearica TaxID=74829 RepID=UPI00190CE0AB|nr:efflux RND transporter periplasmic adaptor subunit [Stutzerimonas balearica]MBK3747069.1 efflux RND transporter periplasmic adaptor subunit [Stutzerimonas balearica]MBK3825266.1 efflux RND transporter periplasmic adaptor subunit [Stutzerimonas balearica]MBK3854957.1 efflux RND transporter periplasmic adaptor subunit [Stutzerimonas balearica]